MKKYSLLIILTLLISCVDDMNHKDIDTTIINPDLSGKTEISFSQLFDLHTNEIGKDTIVTGYVVSIDAEGNYYKEIFVQNTLGTEDLGGGNPRMGMRVRVGITNTYTKYAPGRKIAINLEGLKKTTSDDLLTVGKPSGTYIGDILEFDLDKYILKMDEVGELIPKTVALSDLSITDLNTLVKIENLHFIQEEIGMPFAGLSTDEYDGERTLEYCSGFTKNSIILETSNFADFADELIPNTQLDVTAIYNISFDDEPILVLNGYENLVQTGDYVSCETNTPNVLMTEIADPENASFSRYVELYNAEDVAVALDGWNLTRYVNGGSPSSISLDGLSIPAKGYAIVANDEVSSATNFNFQDSFGFTADIVNNRLDGNGNDAYSLFDGTGTIIDVFGVATQDGSDTDWEYEDGRAYRNLDVVLPNATFTIAEWSIIKDGQNAPDDFSPKERKENEVVIVPVPDVVETAPLLITEVADTQADTKARFVEIYNPTDNDVSLKEWTLVRYNYTSNKNTKELAALPMSLEELIIPSKGFVIVARGEVEFNTYFGVSTDLAASNLDGNGDDAYELIDPYDAVIDVYGNPNEDGSTSDWEYTDGFAKRNIEITSPSTVFNHLDWSIQEDQTEAANYSPRVR